MSHRHFARVAGSLLSLALAMQALPAQAQGGGGKIVRLVVPFPAGGGMDSFTRVLAPKLSESLGHTVIIENRPGAGGNIGAEFVARSAPDGNTLLITPDPVMSTNQFMYRKLSYKASTDFVPVTSLIRFPSAIIARTGLPATSLQQFVALARARPGTLNYGSFGIGTAPHLGMELFKRVGAIEIEHVPYKGVAEVTNALMAGEVDVMFSGLTRPMAELHAAGKFRVLAIAGQTRLPFVPDVPTFAEAGFPAMQGPNWWGVVAPAATPKDIVARLNRDFAQAMASPEVRKWLDTNGFVASPGTPEEAQASIREFTTLWEPVIKSLNISLD